MGPNHSESHLEGESDIYEEMNSSFAQKTVRQSRGETVRHVTADAKSQWEHAVFLLIRVSGALAMSHLILWGES